MKNLVLSSYDDLLPYMDRVFPKLEIACSYSLGRFQAVDIVEYLRVGFMQIWLAFDDDVLDGFILTQIIDYPRAKELRVLCLTGVEIEGPLAFLASIRDWIPHVKTLETHAVSIGCSLVQIECPAQWELLVKDFGYERGHVLLKKEIA